MGDVPAISVISYVDILGSVICLHIRCGGLRYKCVRVSEEVFNLLLEFRDSLGLDSFNDTVKFLARSYKGGYIDFMGVLRARGCEIDYDKVRDGVKICCPADLTKECFVINRAAWCLMYKHLKPLNIPEVIHCFSHI